MNSWTLWMTRYQEVLALPDQYVRQVRLEKLDQDLVDYFWKEGSLLARPKVNVLFENGVPQGVIRSGARAETPGIIHMRSDASGQVPDAMGCAATGSGNAVEAICHRWSVLFHEAAHFTFDQFSAEQLRQVLPHTWSEDLRAGITEHVWAPFLQNLERRRLNEAFADAWSTASLLSMGSDQAVQEIERLTNHRRAGHLAATKEWTENQQFSAWARVHVDDQVLRRVSQEPCWDKLRGQFFLDRVLIHAVAGTIERWQTDGNEALAGLALSWNQIDVRRLRTATLHARHHHDPGVLNRWIDAQPDHPLMKMAQAMRWTAPAPLSETIKGWSAQWENIPAVDLDIIGDAWSKIEGELRCVCSPEPVNTLHRRPRPS